MEIQIQEDADARLFGRAAIINFQQSLTSSGALTHCLHLNFNLDFNFNFNTLSTPTHLNQPVQLLVCGTLSQHN